MPAPASSSSPQLGGEATTTRRVKVHKKKRTTPGRQPTPEEQEGLHHQMDKRIAEIIPAMASLSTSAAPEVQQGVVDTARELRQQRLRAEEVAELQELDAVFDMGTPNPVDFELPAGPFEQKLRPRPRKIVLSPYQYEMINYQRMHLRNNIWYYRDRLSVPRGPCPLHTLKDAWVQVRELVGDWRRLDLAHLDCSSSISRLHSGLVQLYLL